MLGHDAPPQAYWRENLVTGDTLHECPVRTILRQQERNPALVAEVQQHVRTYFPAYERGNLLVAGGMADQPAPYLDLMTMIADMRARTEAKHAELLEQQKREA